MHGAVGLVAADKCRRARAADIRGDTTIVEPELVHVYIHARRRRSERGEER